MNTVTNAGAKNFANILIAVHKYIKDNSSGLYPQHTAIIALNAFFMSVAEKVEELEKLTFLMRSDFRAFKNLKPFTKEDYNKY